MRGAIVVAGGPSRRMGRPKPLVQVGGIPMVARVVRAASTVADEVVVVTRGPLCRRLADVLGGDAVVVNDTRRLQTPLVGLLTGAEMTRSPYVLALACDLPFVNPRVLEALFVQVRGRDAAIPRWPDANIEPLLAAYRRERLVGATRRALAAGERSNQSMVRSLRNVRYVPVDAFRAVDPELRSFENVNTRASLRRARTMARELVGREEW